MTTYSVDDLTTPMTTAEVRDSIYTILSTLGVNTTSWKPGAVVRTTIYAFSIVGAAFTVLMAQIARSGFLELSEKTWLTLVARYVYGVERQVASFATGDLTLNNAGGGVYVVAIGDLTVRNPGTNKTYKNTAGFTLSALQTGLIVPIQAVEAGSPSTSAAATITSFVTPLLGVTCTNANALAGLDDEDDPSLRAQCSERLGALSPFGPWDAYSSAVRGAKRADGSRLGVTRVRLTKDGYGNVTVYVATASGALTSPDLAIAQEAIEQLAATQCVTATATNATPVTIPVTYQVWAYNTSGKTEAQIIAAISARLTAFMAGQPIGGNVIGTDPGKVFFDAIRAAIASTIPEIFHVEVTTPTGDTTLAVSEVPVIGAVTPTAINQVAPPEGFAS